MNKSALFILAICIAFGFSAEAKADISYEKAMENRKKKNKPVLVEFYADWCISCIEMEKTIFKDPTVIKELNSNFYFVRLNIEKEQRIFCEGNTMSIFDCIGLWEIEGLPTFAILDKNGSLRHITEGVFEKAAFLKFLKAVKEK